MRIKLRLRCSHMLKDCLIKSLALTLVGISICQRYVYLILGALFLLLFVWWSTGTSEGCDQPHLVENICQEYFDKYTAGSLCHELCVSKEIQLDTCYSFKDGIKVYKSDDLVFKVSDVPGLVWRQDKLEEGLISTEFFSQVDQLLRHELGQVDTTSLVNQMILDFDSNKDGKMNLGEAQNLWWLLMQPDFISFYIFQDSTAIPHLNGSCGGISMWHYLHLSQGSTLYTRASPWPLSLFSSNTYRWTLPGWIKRAKVMLSLVELAEELYEKDGVRYHLCNVNGLSLHHLSSYEIVITGETMLLSSQQIRNRLSNITCHYAQDCTLTPQCQTSCDYASKQCSGRVSRPTIAHVCDIMDDYLLFDAPSPVKMSLSRLVRRCQSLSLYTQKHDLVHSILILDLKSLLWNFIQNKVK